MNDQEKLNHLQLQRANLLSQLEMLSSASNDFYQQLGKVEADLFLLNRKIIREVKNTIDEA